MSASSLFYSTRSTSTFILCFDMAVGRDYIYLSVELLYFTTFTTTIPISSVQGQLAHFLYKFSNKYSTPAHSPSPSFLFFYFFTFGIFKKIVKH